MKIYEIDGDSFSSLEAFYEVFTNKVTPGAVWGKNLDAFNDMLHYIVPEEGFELIWKNSHLSKERLGSKFDTVLEIIRNSPGIRLKLE